MWQFGSFTSVELCDQTGSDSTLNTLKLVTVLQCCLHADKHTANSPSTATSTSKELHDHILSGSICGFMYYV